MARGYRLRTAAAQSSSEPNEVPPREVSDPPVPSPTTKLHTRGGGGADGEGGGGDGEGGGGDGGEGGVEGLVASIWGAIDRISRLRPSVWKIIIPHSRKAPAAF